MVRIGKFLRASCRQRTDWICVVGVSSLNFGRRKEYQSESADTMIGFVMMLSQDICWV